MNIVYLSERNLRTLLNKLERRKLGEATAATLIKNANPDDPYCQTMKQIAVVAVTDEDYYVTREAGPVLEVDEP